jgi:tetratricopeptide (TPR) repeat protein
MKGLIFKEIGNKEKAISNFQTAIEQNPDLYEAYMQLGLMNETQDKKRAMSYYDNALRVDTNSSEARYAKAMIFQNQNDFENAKLVYRELISKDPQFEQAIYNLGYIYFQQDSIDKAQRHFEMAIKVNPAYPDAVYMMGLCEESKKNYPRALYFYKQTLNLDDKHALALKGMKRLNGNSKQK